jgi:hypothetical protein
VNPFRLLREDEIPLLVFFVLIVASFFLNRGCQPKDHDMLVISVQGDVNFPALTMRSWDFGETQKCEIAELASGTAANTETKDILLCGETSFKAWSTLWLKNEIKGQLLQASRRLAVRFHSAGHRKGKNQRFWKCTRTSDWLECN